MKDTRETSSPSIEDYGLGYRLQWGPEDITAIVSHISEDRQELKCEIRFTYTESQAHIKQQRLVCNSSSGKTSLARDLRSQANHVNWDAIIEQLTFKTIERHRQGNPPETIHIEQGDDVIPPKFLVWPFIIDKEMNLLYARGGKGKTLVMQTILVLSQVGEVKNKLGLGISRPTIGGILDYESTNSSLRYRATRLLRGMDIPAIDIEYQSCHGSITENLEKIGNWVSDRKIEYLLIDSVGMAADDSHDISKDTRAATSMAKALRRLNVASLLLHHMSKGQALPGQESSSFGTVYFENECRNNWEILPEDQEFPEHLDITFRHKKANDVPKVKDFSWRYTFAEDAIVPAKIDAADCVKARKSAPQWQQIKDLLENGARTTDELAQVLTLPPKQIDSVCYRSKSIFTRPKDGYWGLITVRK